MLTYIRFATIFILASHVIADVYLHGSIRGSNNRNCRNDNAQNRRNGNRLFDSQNNDNGGYSCPRAYPFTKTDNTKCNGNCEADVDAYGKLSSTANNAQNGQTVYTVDTPTFYIYGGSKVHLEWTNQHGAGANENMHADVVLQYMTDDVIDPSVSNSVLATGNEHLRDGTPTTTNSGDNAEDEATTRIDSTKLQDGRYGYQETYDSYEICQKTSRNKGLFIADQNLNKDTAQYTRQDSQGTRYGFECPEEKDYWPYWRPSAWHDIAVITKDVERCKLMSKASQNIPADPTSEEGLATQCQCEGTFSVNNPAPITEQGCASESGNWKCAKAWSEQPHMCGHGRKTWACDAEPECLQAAYSRDNHLGNQLVANETLSEDMTQSDRLVTTANYVWTVPEFLRETKVVLRLRYNTSTHDFPFDLDSSANGDASPIKDRNAARNEVASYIDIGLGDSDIFGDSGCSSEICKDRYRLSMAVNTDQYARTFQDRTYTFIVKPIPTDPADDDDEGHMAKSCRGRIHNLNVRGKRGNIVQTYPSVEYDFSPQDFEIVQNDCLHVQWIGSDYNPNRNPNNAEGGPYQPNNENEAKADRVNLVQMHPTDNGGIGGNYPMHLKDIYNDPGTHCMWFDRSGKCSYEGYRKLAFINQDHEKCKSIEELRSTINDQNDRQRSPFNCGKLNMLSKDQTNRASDGTGEGSHPYFNAGIFRIKNFGVFKFMSTRNNNFSNRSQKLKVAVTKEPSKPLSAAQIFGFVVLGFVLAGGSGFALVKAKRRGIISAPNTSFRKNSQPAGPPPNIAVRPSYIERRPKV